MNALALNPGLLFFFISHWFTRVLLPSSHLPSGDGITWDCTFTRRDPMAIWPFFKTVNFPPCVQPFTAWLVCFLGSLHFSIAGQTVTSPAGCRTLDLSFSFFLSGAAGQHCCQAQTWLCFPLVVRQRMFVHFLHQHSSLQSCNSCCWLSRKHITASDLLTNTLFFSEMIET